MADNTAPLVYVDLYQGQPGVLARLAGRAQRWRWRALNGNNFRVLAVSSEAYTNYVDAVDAVIELFGARSNVYLRQAEQGNQLLRLADSSGDTG